MRRHSRIVCRGGGVCTARGVVVLALLATLLGGEAASRWRAEEVTELPRRRGLVPFAPSRLLDLDAAQPGGRAALPAPVREFADAQGADWTLFWDDLLATPRFLAPRSPEPIELVPGGDVVRRRDEAVVAVRRFVDAHAGLFGVTAAALSPPDDATTFAIGDGLVVVFAQRVETPLASLPVRGTALRAYIAGDGRLVWIKAYLLRGAQRRYDDSGADAIVWLDANAVGERAVGEARAEEGDDGATMHALRRELVFLDADVDDGDRLALTPVWAVELAATDGVLREELRAAATGEVLAGSDLVEHFEFTARFAARTADLTDPFALREEIVEVPQGFRPTIVRDRGDTAVAVVSCEDGTDGPGTGRVLIESSEWLSRLRVVVAGDTTSDASCLEVLASRESPERLPCAGDEGSRLDDVCPELLLTPLVVPTFGLVLPWSHDDRLRCLMVCDDGFAGPTLQPIVEMDEVAELSFDLVFNAVAMFEDAETPELAAWLEEVTSGWLHDYHHADRVLRAARAVIDSDLPDVGRFGLLRLQPLDWSEGPPQGAPRVEAAADGAWLRYSPLVGAAGPSYRVNGTIIAHEVGHHLMREITGALSMNPVGEGIADALGAYALEEPRIGFQRVDDDPEQLVEGPVGRDLGRSLDELAAPEEGESVEERQTKLGAFAAVGFWRLWQIAEGPRLESPEVAARLLYRWIATNRALEGAPARGVDDASSLLEELLGVNAAMGDPDEPRTAFFAEELAASFPCHVFSRAIDFLRGDVNFDSRLDVTDAIGVLTFLFGGEFGFHNCLDAHDTDDNGRIDLADAIFTLNHLFLGGEALRPPFPLCGRDPSRDALCCIESPCPDGE